MKTEKTTIRSSYDDLALSVMTFTPDTAPKAVIQIVHGMCEHKERYIPFMEFLCSNGYACIIHDHRGHGASVKAQEDLGYMYEGGWKGIVDDILAVNRHAAGAFPGCRIHLFGHSMGSLAVRSFAKRYGDLIRSLIVCGSPSMNPAAGAGKMLTRIIAAFKGDRHRPALIQKIAFEGFNRRFAAEGPNSWISTDKAIVKAYNEDTLCSYQFTCNGFTGLFDLMQDCYDIKGWKVADPDMPVHFIAGSDDPCITDAEMFGKAADMMGKAGYRKVTSHLYEGMRHEILNETEKDKVWNDVLRFIEENN